MDEEDINEDYVAQLLADAMIRMRMTAYGIGVESPSAAGLKMDLDRLRDELGEFLRERRKAPRNISATSRRCGRRLTRRWMPRRTERKTKRKAPNERAPCRDWLGAERCSEVAELSH